MAQFIVPATLLAAIVKAAVSHSGARDDMSVISGVLVETDEEKGEIRFVSTDGYRLYHRTIGSKEQISGQFPNYQQIIPERFKHEITVDRKALLGAVKAMPGMSVDGNPITLALNGKCEISGTDKLGNHLNQSLPALASRHDDDPEVTITFNASYLADALNAVDASAMGNERKTRNKTLQDQVKIRVNGPVNAAMIVADTLEIPYLDADAGRSLLMPIRT